MSSTFKVYNEPCNNCLLSKDAIVSPERRKEIISEIKREQSYFICHKASFEGKNICCKAFFDKMGEVSQLIRIAERLNVVEEVEQTDNRLLTPYRDYHK
jgi:hypothetical protein